MRSFIYFAIALVSAEASANQSYSLPGVLNHRVDAICLSESLSVSFSLAGNDTGVRQIVVAGKPLEPRELAKVRDLIGGARPSDMKILGCRRTKMGDVRHWLLVDPPVSEENLTDPLRAKWFYIRRGKVEVHQRQPVD